MKLKKITSILGASLLGSVPIVAATSIIYTRTNQDQQKHDQIIRGQQFLKDHYSNINDRRSSLIAIINREIKGFDLLLSVANVQVLPLSNHGNVELYTVSLEAFSPQYTQSKLVKFNVSLNLDTQIVSYPQYGPSFTKFFGNPADSGFDVNFINYLQTQNYLALNQIIKAIYNTKQVMPVLKPFGKNAIDVSMTGSGVTFQKNKNYEEFELKIAYQTEASGVAFKLDAYYDQKTGITTIPELFS